MKVGDYVRTKHGIEKITDIKEWVNFRGYEKIITTDKNKYETLYEQSEIIKSSPNIIDLIEIGDYVNGHLVKNRRASCNENLGGHPKQVDIGENEDYIWISESKIKTIVTKEQFKNMEYEVK